MAAASSTHPPFEQAFYPSGPLTVAFESARVSYSDLPVDLYNSGVNQILSVAAVRGHRLLHFSMADLHERSGQPAADVSVLELDPGWDGSDPLHAHRHLRVSERRTVPLADVQLFVLRADDVRTPEETPNIEILREATAHAKTLESLEATLSTTDKYAPLERDPQLPHPVTFPASTSRRRSRPSSASPARSPTSCSRTAMGTAVGPRSTGWPSTTPTATIASPATSRPTATC